MRWQRGLRRHQPSLTMIKFEPTLARGKSARRTPSPQTLISNEVEEFGVVCVGAEEGCLYFKRLSDSAPPTKNGTDASAIIAKLFSEQSPVAELLRNASITSISIE